ncbi:hypothetical protein FIBSPDRAFT_724999 [Athelia psychrophila]|uniref:Uncharacterized protein n=1 Tax=Athelia psychrophila TaxID=1759441 RepID=A0A166TTV2_9AGAM|nr:hypothetical protein FIBSPDRAFT_724999 [Fibularhizoctonia sp. CBS 109695]
MKEPSGNSLTVHVIDGSLKVSNSVQQSQQISLRELGTAALTAITEFTVAVDALLQSNSTVTSATFPLEKVTDTYERCAIHKQEANRIWMDPIRKTVKEGLTAPEEEKHHLRSPRGTLRRGNVEAWLRLEQEALGLLGVVIGLSNALILPQGYFKYFKFDATETSDRDTWVSPNLMVFLSNPKTDLNNRPMKSDIYVFPPDSSRAVLLYLCIIRPIACYFLDVINKHVPHYDTVIWANAFRRSSTALTSEWRWSGRDISRPFRRLTFRTMGVALTPSLLRSIGRAIFPAQFPRLFEDAFPSYVDAQAQHVSSTGSLHYGRLRSFPKFQNISPAHTVRAIAMSQIWQAALGTGPLNEAWQDLAAESSLFPIRNIDMAFEEARWMVFHSYCIHISSIPLKVQGIIQSLLKDKPFLYGPKVSDKFTAL